jgi:hypothetical protein
MSENGFQFAWNKYSNLLPNYFARAKRGDEGKIIELEDIIDQTLSNVTNDIENKNYLLLADKYEENYLTLGDFGYYAEILYVDNKINDDGTLRGKFITMSKSDDEDENVDYADHDVYRNL